MSFKVSLKIVIFVVLCGGFDCKNFKNLDVYNNNDSEELTLEDQVKVLNKQLNALINRRREDFQQLENNLKKSLKITAQAEHVDMDIRNEIAQLRYFCGFIFYI